MGCVVFFRLFFRSIFVFFFAVCSTTQHHYDCILTNWKHKCRQNGTLPLLQITRYAVYVRASYGTGVATGMLVQQAIHDNGLRDWLGNFAGRFGGTSNPPHQGSIIFVFLFLDQLAALTFISSARDWSPEFIQTLNARLSPAICERVDVVNFFSESIPNPNAQIDRFVPNKNYQSAFNRNSPSFVALIEAEYARLQNSEQPRTGLRHHQIEALWKISNYFKGDNMNAIGIVQLPTGTGKSAIALLAPYVVDATRVLILTPAACISAQIGRDVENASLAVRLGLFTDEAANRRAFSPSHHVIMYSDQIRESLSSELVITNAHKFGGEQQYDRTVRIDQIPPDQFDMVIVDEAHHYPAETWRRVVDRFTSARRLFLTATAYHRNHAPILESQDAKMILTLPIQDAIDRGIIRRLAFFQVDGNELGLHPYLVLLSLCMIFDMILTQFYRRFIAKSWIYSEAIMMYIPLSIIAQ